MTAKTLFCICNLRFSFPLQIRTLSSSLVMYSFLCHTSSCFLLCLLWAKFSAYFMILLENTAIKIPSQYMCHSRNIIESNGIIPYFKFKLLRQWILLNIARYTHLLLKCEASAIFFYSMSEIKIMKEDKTGTIAKFSHQNNVQNKWFIRKIGYMKSFMQNDDFDLF